MEKDEKTKNIEDISFKDPEVEFIRDKYETLKSRRGIIVLRPMSKERRKNLYKIIEDFPGLKAFSIGKDKTRRIVLRYTSKTQEINIKEVMTKGNAYYDAKEYRDSLVTFQKLLTFGNPPHYVYSKIGLCYLRLGKTQLGLQYLTVGSELAKEVNSTYEFSELVDRITGVISDDDVKNPVKMKVNDFEDKSDYGISNLDEIINCIDKEKLDVNTICEQKGLTENEANIVKLMYARNCYTNDKYIEGDKFLKQVEKSQEKTQLVKKLFIETQKNKRFYRNRKSDK